MVIYTIVQKDKNKIKNNRQLAMVARLNETKDKEKNNKREDKVKHNKIIKRK